MTQIDFEKYMSLMASFIEAPTWKALAIVVGILAMAALMIAKYFWDENKRKENAYREAMKVREEQNKNLQRLQQETTQAFLANIDAAYKQDFEYYRDKIAQNKTADIWGKVPYELQEEVTRFVFRDDLKPEEKSARIILAVRRK